MGRTAAFEVLVIDDDARQLVREGKLDQLRAHVRRQRTLWLEEAALAKVVSGETSIGEVMRALGREQKESAPAPASGKNAAAAAAAALGASTTPRKK